MPEFWEACSKCGVNYVDIKVSVKACGEGTRLGREFFFKKSQYGDEEIYIECSECDTDLTDGFSDEELNKIRDSILIGYLEGGE